MKDRIIVLLMFLALTTHVTVIGNHVRKMRVEQGEQTVVLLCAELASMKQVGRLSQTRDEPMPAFCEGYE